MLYKFLLFLLSIFKKPRYSLQNKILVGYQGWFGCPEDGSALNSWFHWNELIPIWPDVSGMKTYTFKTNQVYSAYDEQTVDMHFKWMAECGIDGAFLQRFVCELSNARRLEFRNKVLENAKKAAEKHGRELYIMYDISGQDASTLYETLTTDSLNMSSSIVALWGFGFKENDCTPEVAKRVISYFKSKGCTVVGGVPAYYQTLSNDCKPDKGWREVFNMLDVISPWTVGRYVDESSFDEYRKNVALPNMVAALWKKQAYLPVVFPGYEFPNKPSVSRNGGKFFAHQLQDVSSAYVAMFDEVDEATAVYKTLEYSDQYLKIIANKKAPV